MSATSVLPGLRNLTREEAAQRSRLLTVHRYDITLDLAAAAGPGQRTFGCRTEIEFSATHPDATTSIEIAATAIHTATLNGRPLRTDGWTPERGLTVTGLAAANRLVIEADFEYSSSGQGLHRSVDPVDGEVYLYTHFEPCAAQRVFACFDQPDLKAEFVWHARVPTHWQVVSNMPALPAGPGDAGPGDAGPGDAGSVDAGSVDGPTRTVHFAQTPRMSTYLAALCAGPYHGVHAEHDGIELGLWCRRSLAGLLDAEEFLDVTRRGFDFFHTQFGIRYPLAKYDQLLVPDYNTGAMENLGAVTFSEERYLFRSRVTKLERANRANTILHEMAHIWFGNLVTMYWWDDLWLKESFATWAAYWAAAGGASPYPDAWAGFLATRKVWGYRQDQLSSTHPIYADIPDLAATVVNFDGITYAKGASFLKQLVAYVGQPDFVAGLRDYFTTHLWGNADLADLIRALERSCGRSLGPLTDQWLRTAQVNTLRPELELDPEGRYQRLAIRQEAPAGHPTLRTHRLVVGVYERDGQRIQRQRRQEVEVSGPVTEVPELIGVPAGDLLLLNDEDLTYAKIRLDERSLATLGHGLGRITDPTARALGWNACWDLVRDAELPATDYLALALRNLPDEPHEVLLASNLARVGQTLTEYTDPVRADAGWLALARAAQRALAEAAPASGAQLTWARAYASAAREPADLAVLDRWWGGRDLPPGLALDAELRWHLLHCLVALDAAGPAQIEAALADDETTSGMARAAEARALLPDAAAKEAVWSALTDVGPLPNWRARSLAQGFQHPAQAALTRPYTQRFHAEVERIWQGRGPAVSQWVVPLVYPSHQVRPEVLAASEEWLAQAGRPAPLRRLVAEGRDELARALAARTLDSGRG